MDRQELYHIAIMAEVRSQNLYRALARSFKHPDTTTFFTELMQLELGHEEKLRLALESEFPGYIFVLDADIQPDFSGLDLTDPLQVLNFAVGREDIAHQQYMAFAEHTQDLHLKEMLLRLAAEEEDHKSLLMTEMERIQGTLNWFDPSELNGFMDD